MGYLSKGDRITSTEQDLIDIIGVLGDPLDILRVNAAGTSLEYAASGGGTVTSVSVVTANGVSGSVATATSTPAITLTLGSIAPSAVNISGLTASEIVGTDSSKNLVSLAVATYPSLAELAYVKGVTSSIQTQLGTKAPSTAPTFATSITGSYLTASEILITDGSKNIVSAAVATYPSLTELTYLKGVTSAIQTQFTGKQATLVSGTNIKTVNGTTLLGSGDLVVSGGITWSEETGTSATMDVNNGYISNNAGLVTFTLPTTAAVGDVVRVAGKGAGGWKIAQNASEIIHFGSIDTTTGTGGSLASVVDYDAVELVCVVANTEWVVVSSVGNITIV